MTQWQRPTRWPYIWSKIQPDTSSRPTAGRTYTLEQIEAERMARHHSLKTWPQFFEKLLTDEKTAELRNDDRHFAVGDVLCLQEYDPASKQYTGREVIRTISHILKHSPDAGCAATFGLQPGYVILSLRR